MREVDAGNVLNYRTDSDDEDEDSDDLGADLDRQKQSLVMNDGAWGKNKKNYYKADSDSEEKSDDEEDLAKEALRL
jgi:hypothetical protein